MTTRDEAADQRRAMADGRTHWQGCWREYEDCADRRIDERIAKALEAVARDWRSGIVTIDQVLRKVAAELRAAGPASEPTLACENCNANAEGYTPDDVPLCNRCARAIEEDEKSRSAPAPPPSLVERLRDYADSASRGNNTDDLVRILCAAADAIEAAQAKHIELHQAFDLSVQDYQRVSAELAKAQADTRRIDALEADGFTAVSPDDELQYMVQFAWTGPDRRLRAAIDRALAATMERKP